MDDTYEEAMTALMREIPTLQQATGVPAISLALVRDAAVVGVAACGLASVQPPRPVTADTLFQAASLSKPLFAYAVLGLVAQGDLELDTPLTSYVPDLYVPDDPLLTQITARYVLCHMTGWPNWRPEGGPLVRARPPGTAFGYSGEGYLYLQTAIERIVGQPLDAYMQEVVFKALGMHASTYRWAAAGDPAVAQAHDRTGQPLAPYVGDRPEASSSLHTTPTDFARFLCALLNAGAKPGYLQASSIAEMLHPQVELADGVAWGLGWGLENSDHGTVCWHWGDNPGYKCLTVAEPAERMGIVMMTNGDGGLQMCERLVRLIFDYDHPGFRWLASAFYDAPTLADM